ncbi:hypothetical protein ACP70R_039050 [Stipagrostis hirtigluma subsp. patula]
MALKLQLQPWSHWAFLLFLVLLSHESFVCRNGVEATQRVFLYPQSPKVSSIVSKRYRTAYHFQPPKNWINAFVFASLMCWNLWKSMTTQKIQMGARVAAREVDALVSGNCKHICPRVRIVQRFWSKGHLEARWAGDAWVYVARRGKPIASWSSRALQHWPLGVQMRDGLRGVQG